MIRLATALGVRRFGRTVFGVNGPYSLQDGTAVRSFHDGVRRLEDGKTIWAYVGTEGGSTLIQRRIAAILREQDSDIEATARHFAAEWISKDPFRSLCHPLLLANRERLFRLGPDGEVAEPSDGVVAVGMLASFTMGAAKALIANTTLDGDSVVREALRLTVEASQGAGPSLLMELE